MSTDKIIALTPFGVTRRVVESVPRKVVPGEAVEVFPAIIKKEPNTAVVKPINEVVKLKLKEAEASADIPPKASSAMNDAETSADDSLKSGSDEAAKALHPSMLPPESVNPANAEKDTTPTTSLPLLSLFLSKNPG